MQCAAGGHQKARVSDRVGLAAPFVAVIRLVADDDIVRRIRPAQGSHEARITSGDGRIVTLWIGGWS